MSSFVGVLSRPGTNIGSGRKTKYKGQFKVWPRTGRRFILERSDSRRSRTFKTSTVVKVEKVDKETRKFKTKHGNEYMIAREQLE